MKKDLKETAGKPLNHKVDSQSVKSNHDFIVVFIVCLYLLADFMPYYGRTEIIKPQFFYLNILNVLVSAFIYFRYSHFSVALLSNLKKSYAFKAYLAFLALCTLSAFVTKNLSLTLNNLAEIFVVLNMLLNLAILLYNRLHLIHKIAFIVSICAFIQSFDVLSNLKSLTDGKILLEFLNSNYLKGNTGNINILSSSLLAKIPFIFLSIIHFKGFKKLFASATLLLSVIIILFISARASLLSLIIISILFIVYIIKTSPVKKVVLTNIIYILISLIFAVGFTNYIFSKQKLGDRFGATTNRLSSISTNEASANLRLHYWKNAFELTKKNPVLGVGLGNYRIESVPYDFNDNNIIALHAHNDFLEIFAETGILNGLVYLSIFISLLFVNAKRLFGKEGSNSQIAFLAILLLVIYGIDSLFNFPMYRPTMQFSFCFLMVFTIINRNKIDENIKNASLKYFTPAAIIVALIPLYFTYNADATSLLENKILSDDINSGVLARKLTGDSVINFPSKYPNVFATSETFVEYAGIYYYREKKYDKAIKYLNEANTINPYLGRPYFYKYLVARDMGNPDSAYRYIKAAVYTRPTTSFYTQAIIVAQLHKDTAEIIKMYNYAKTINKNPYVFTQAFNSLQNLNYSKFNLDKFIADGKIEFKNDSLVNRTILNQLIADKITKGQQEFHELKYPEALATYLEGDKIDPGNIYIMQNIGFYYYNLGNYSKAIPYFLKALNKPGLADGKTEYYLGTCFLNLGNKESAYKYFNLSNTKGYPDAKAQLLNYNKPNSNKFIANGKNDPLVNRAILNQLIADKITKGQQEFHELKYPEALATYLEGDKIDAGNIYIMQNIGFYYYNLHNYSKAIPYFLKALNKPGLADGKTEYYLGICFLTIGNKENANKYFNLSNTKGYPDAKAQLKTDNLKN